MAPGRNTLGGGSSAAYESASDAQDDESILVFLVSDLALGVFARQVDLVSGVDDSTPVPGAPPYIPGLVSTREKVVPLVDVGLFLNLRGREGPGLDPMFRRTLFVTAGDLEAGLICDRAHGLVPFRPTALEAPTVLECPQLKPLLIAELAGEDGVLGLLDLRAFLEATTVK